MTIRWRDMAIGAAVALALWAVLFAIALAIITATPWGREQVRSVAIDALNEAIAGEARVARIEGNLLGRVHLVDVTIVDQDGERFVDADRISVRVAPLGLLRQRVILRDVRLENARVLLDKRPGQDWNFVRIFVPDPEAERDPSRWGHWIELREVELIDSDLVVRTAWEPSADLSPAERDAAIRKALAGETRQNIVAVADGYQNVMTFKELDARLDRVVITHPRVDGIPIGVDQFSGIVQPFRPPVAEVRDLRGEFLIRDDTLFFRDVDARLPDSDLRGEGAYIMEKGELVLSLEGAPVAFADLRWLYPPLPNEGGGTLRLTLDQRGSDTRIVARNIDVAVREARVRGRFGMTLGDTLRFHDTNVAFARVDTRLVQDIAPALQLPRHGLLTGEVMIDGTPRALQVDADVTFDDHAAPASRLIAEGRIAFHDGLAFSDFRMRAQPVRAELIRAFAPDAPVAGAIEGVAHLTGRPDGLLDLDADLTMRDPATGVSRIEATGGLDLRDELHLHDLRVRADPLRLDLLRPHVDGLPAGASLTGEALLSGAPARALRLDARVAIHEPRSGTSRIDASGGIVTQAPLRFQHLDLRLDPLRLDLLRAEVPDLPPGATVAGPLRLNGAPSGMLHVDGELLLDDPASGVSRVAATGGIAPGEPRLDGLHVRVAPLQAALIRRFDPEFPLGGIFEGTASLDGWPDTGLSFMTDLTHREGAEVSHVAGHGFVETGTAPGQPGRVEADLRVEPIDLRTVGRFVPEAGLQGKVAGTVTARGTMADLALHASLSLPDTAALILDGRFDLTAAEPRYAFDAQLAFVNLAAVTTHAPAETALTGTLQASGRGTAPETMQARLGADLVGARVDDLAADRILVRAEIDDGLLAVDPAEIRLATAEARFEGTFGLVPERSGELHYRIEADSLEAFQTWLPEADTAAVALRPEARRRAEEAAAEARARAERAALIEALATGKPPRPPEPVDTLPPLDLRRGTVAGSLRAEGTIRGNVEAFDLEGTAEAERLVWDGNYVESGSARYAVAGIGTEVPEGDIAATTSAVRIEGFAFDSTAVEVSYRGTRFGEGQARLVAVQNEHTDLTAEVDFRLALDRNEVHITESAFRFDDVTWTGARPATIAWGDEGVEIENLELLAEDGGRIYVDGLLPLEGRAALDIEVDGVELAHLLRILQEDADLTGQVALRARIDGTAESPRLEAEAAITEIVYDGRPMPDARAVVQYADLTLTAEAEAVDEGVVVAEASARLPADLSLTGETGPRVLDGPIEADLRADALPLELVHLFTDDVRIEEGLASGRVRVRGTTGQPEVSGDLGLAAVHALIRPAGVRFERVRGAIRLEGTDLVIDTLVAWSGGPISLSGTIDVADAAEPGFDLTLTARDAWVIDTDDANLRVDADLSITGPLYDVEIAGDTRIREGVIYIPELLAEDGADPIDLDDPETFDRVDDALVARRDALVDRSPVLDNLHIDVSVFVERDVWLRSTEANIEIYTPPEVGPLTVRMDGLTNGPILLGTVNADRGEYEFMSRRLQVTRAAATFDGQERFNPFIQLVAEHDVRPPGSEAVNIRVLLTGTLDDLELELESDAQPPIPQTDLMAYFVFGRDASSLLGHHGSTLAGQGATGVGLIGDVTTVATQQLAGVFLDAIIGGFEYETARALGLDVFRVTTSDLPQDVLTGRVEDILRGTEFEAGAYLTSRIFVAGQVRPTLAHPGLLFEYGRPEGLMWRVTLRPRYLAPVPTLEETEPERISNFGSFVRKRWRF